jgi:soluble lytic murein transglycosylase
LGLSAREASARLQRGDIDFLLNAGPGELEGMRGFDPEALFYAGLLVQAAEDAVGLNHSRGAILFTHALKSSKGRIQEEAARELIRELLREAAPGEDRALLAERVLGALRGKRTRFDKAPFLGDLYAAALYTLGRFGEVEALYREGGGRTPWGAAFSLLAPLRLGESPGEGGADAAGDRARFLAFFLEGPLEEPQRWALGELDKIPSPGSPPELAAVSGRFSVSRRAYGEGLSRFRLVLDQAPALFLAYPELLSDLGRAFLYTTPAALEEGAGLFREWEDALAAGTGPGAPAETRATRFRLGYYRGRFLRQQGRYAEAAELFDRALPFAPDPLQKDACIWYILSDAETAAPAGLAALLKTYAPLWHSDRYFADIYDRLSRRLVVNRQWETFLAVFPLVRSGTDGATTAQYAYIIGRAVLEGYIPAPKAGALLSAGDPRFSDGDTPDPEYKAGTARTYFGIAFEEGKASFYYRALSASQLGKTVVPIPEGAVPDGFGASRLAHREEVKFLLDFFSYGAASHAFPYLQRVMEDLTIPELRLLAEAFTQAGLWEESVRITGNYMDREDYEMTRRDMELSFPQPFIEIIEASAREEDLPPEILFGLIRTESAFTADAVSRAGAIGLTQLMPATALDMARRISRQGGPDYIEAGEIDLRDPLVNIPLGARYLRYLWDRMGSPMLALTAYNGGMGRVPRWKAAAGDLSEDLFPETIEYPETRNYGRKVLAAAAAYGYLYYGMSMEAVLADIFK